MKNKIPFIILVIVIFLVVGFFVSSSQKNIQQTTQSQTNGVLFPESNDRLVIGRTYTLKWTKGEGNTNLFLSDKALQSQGQSVSLVDRIYNIPNTGTYEYTIPQNLPEGEYQIQIGGFTSDYFRIIP